MLYIVETEGLPKVARKAVVEWGEQVVHCADCIHNLDGYCEVFEFETIEEGYCFLGEDGMDDTYSEEEAA